MRPFAYLTISIAISICSCTTSPQPLQWQDPKITLDWPTPPDPPRIHYLRSFSNDAEFGERTKIVKLFSWLTGEKTVSLPFISPYGITADGRGKIWVADIGIHGVHIIDIAHKNHSYILTADEQPLESPVGVAADPSHNLLYVSDSKLCKVFIYQQDDASFIDEITPPDGFGRPAGLAVNSQGDLFVVDAIKNRIFVFSAHREFLREIASQSPPDYKFNYPSNIAIDGNGTIYITDTLNFRVEMFDPSGKSLGTFGHLGDSFGTFGRPRGIGVDADGHIYVVDAAFNNIQIFDITGQLLLYFGKSGKAPGEFSLPSGLFIDQDNRIYVTDTMNHRISIFEYLRQSPPQATYQ